ncbi:MAG: efflux RND transporter periplasmic adaptor subunit, partial [Endomicrobiales bacterium]
RKDVSRTIRTNGRVAYDPELYYAEQEYITSIKSYEQSKNSSEGMVSDSARSLVDASRFKLKLMGLGDAQINDLAAKGVPDSSLLLTRGEKNVWVYASVYQDDLRYVKTGQTVLLSAPSITSAKFSGKIVAIDPVLDPGTRSAKARILTENSSDTFKPETYLNVEINVPLGSQVVIPADAVMDTGARQVVFVDKGQGVLEPKEVKVSNRTDDFYVIKSGISVGDKVVTNANFLIDSESQLKASMQKAVGGGEHKH